MKLISEKEAEYQAKLKQIDEETTKYELELQNVNKEAAELEKSDQQYWEKISEFESKLIETEEESGKVKNDLSHISAEYQRLSSINVINDVFKITCPERVAAINGFKLGRLQTEDVFFIRNYAKNKVKWEEINTALGQVAALLSVLSAKLNFDDPIFTIIPRGSLSKIKIRDKKTILYNNGNETEFNSGLVALVEFVNNFCTYIFVLVESIGTESEIPRLPKYFPIISNKTIELLVIQ